MLEEFGRDVFVDMIFHRKLERDAHQVEGMHRHPCRSVGLIDVSSGGQRRGAVEDPDIVQAQKAALKNLAPVRVLTIDPPVEIQALYIQTVLSRRRASEFRWRRGTRPCDRKAHRRTPRRVDRSSQQRRGRRHFYYRVSVEGAASNVKPSDRRHFRSSAIHRSIGIRERDREGAREREAGAKKLTYVGRSKSSPQISTTSPSSNNDESAATRSKVGSSVTAGVDGVVQSCAHRSDLELTDICQRRRNKTP
jgi:hypothetical protein